MRNLRLSLAFDGSRYHGWQMQQNAVTVQALLREALARICGKEETIIGCSRTDAGVHARIYVCSVRSECRLPCETLVHALNGNLPRDIVILTCDEVPPDFHAQYACTGKTYCYHIHNARQRNPFCEGYALHYPQKLDVGFLHGQARDFVGKHDFSAFCAAGGSVQSTVRTVTEASVGREGDCVVFSVAADGFLYNMVRILTGTLLAIAQGKLAPGSIPAILESRDRDCAGATAPAQGLFLTHVCYADRDFESEYNRRD